MTTATCTGCGIDSRNTGEFDQDNPVTEDGTYKKEKFVCTVCYCRLIDFRKGDYQPDIGPPDQVQENARKLLNVA